MRGVLLYPIAILMIFFLVLTFRDRLEESQTWNSRQFETALEQGDVAAVVITQNKEVPTGVLRVTLENGEIKYVNVTDVNESGKLLEQYEDVEVDTTDVARAMVTKFGMSDSLGLIDYGNEDDEVFIGRDLAHTRSYSEGVASQIDAEVKRIIDEAHEKARQMVSENMDVLHACAKLLMEKEKIGRAEFEALFEA